MSFSSWFCFQFKMAPFLSVIYKNLSWHFVYSKASIFGCFANFSEIFENVFKSYFFKKRNQGNFVVVCFFKMMEVGVDFY